MAELFSVEVTLSLWIPKRTILPLQVGFEATSAIAAILYTFETQTTPTV